MENSSILTMIFGMAAVTYIPRVVPAMVLAQRKLPESLVQWLHFVPMAVLATVLFPALLLPEGKVDVGFANLPLWVAFPTFIFARRTQSFLGTLIFGVVLLALGRYLSIAF